MTRARRIYKSLSRTPIQYAAALCLLPLLIAHLGAQHYSFDQVNSGLSNPNVNCAAQDSSGYLWVGTESGLYRFDGVRFTRFAIAQRPGSRTIQALLAGADGTLLVGTTQGIFFRDAGGSFREIPPPVQVPAFSLNTGDTLSFAGPGRAVMVDHQRAYLLQQNAVGLWRAAPLALPGQQIGGIVADHAGTFWYGCDDDLCRFDHGRTTRMGATLHLPAAHWQHLLFDRNDHLWLRNGTEIEEVNLAAHSYAEHRIPGSFNTTAYDTLSLDATGRVLASQGPAFGIWQRDHWRMVTPRQGLSRYGISTLLTDHDGTLWLGVLGHGLLRWIGQERWEAYTADDGLSDETVWTTLRDRTGRLWIGTDSGLDWIPAGGNTARHWRSPGISTNRLGSLALDADGSLWFGTANGVLGHIDNRTATGRSWQLSKIYRLLYGPRSRLWIATSQGLYTINPRAPGKGPRLVTAPAIVHSQAAFYDLKTDAAGNLWLCSDDALYRLDASGWARINLSQVGAVPHQLAIGRDGTFWAAGLFSGLLRMRIAGNVVVASQHIAPTDLLSDQIVSLLIDSRGWLWVGQDSGLSMFDGAAWRSFTQEDGLIWNDTDSYALYEDNDSSLWIGTSGGLSHLLKPAAVFTVPPKAPAVARMIFGTAEVTDGSQILWHKTPLEIELAPLNFRDAHRLRIRYRLLGLETGWTESSAGRPRYPSLPPGRYILEAIVSDASGAVSPAVRIHFRIVPRWWQTWEAKLIAILLAAALIALLWHWRVRHLVAQKHQLEQAVLERTRDLEKEKDELLHTREQLRHLAEHDDLTGLLNHRVILNRLRSEIARALRQSQPLSLIMIDIDHFKQVNDTYGHPSGDVVLKEVGAILQSSIRTYDWVGRYGGEEFLIILPGSSVDGAQLRAEQLREAITAATVLDGQHTIQVTASFGVAAGFPQDMPSMIRLADQALYRAKSGGRNCVIAVDIAPTDSVVSFRA